MDPPLFKPKCTEPYYTRTVLPIEECRCTEIPRADGPPPKIQAKVYRALLHQDSITYRRMQTYWDTQSRWTAPANQAKVYRALLHQDSITYRRMQIYWDTQSRWTVPQYSNLKCTEPYYTRTVLPIEEMQRYWDIQSRWTPLLKA